MPIFFRFIVVFLQATVEDLVRIQLPNTKKFSFQSGAEIDKALKHAGFDSSSLKIAIIIGVARFNQSTARSPNGPRKDLRIPLEDPRHNLSGS
jgi:hypothetical protein